MGIIDTQKPVRDRKPGSAGFTLIELLIVVAIIGIITAAAIPGLIGAINQARQKKTMAEMATMSTAIGVYYLDHGLYPIVPDGVAQDLNEFLAPHIIKIVPRDDGWGREFRYSCNTGREYTVVSLGLNGQPDTPYIVGPTRRFLDDIVQSGGHFVQWPDGAQY